MQTFMETEQRKLLKKFHTLLGKANVGQDGKEAILMSYGVESSRDLSAKDLLDICEKLAVQADPKLGELDAWRKRVIAAIFAYYKASGKSVNIDYVKGTACRASGFDAFNHIPLARLYNLYYAFKDKVKDRNAVNSIAKEDLSKIICLN